MYVCVRRQRERGVKKGKKKRAPSTIFFFVNRKVWQEHDNPDKLFGPKVLNALIYLNSDPS